MVGVTMKVAVADPNFPANVIKPNADGSINISALGGGGSTVTRWNETTTPLGGSATFNGTLRASPANASYFNADFIANQSGTAFLDGSNDGGLTWVAVTTATAGAITANTPVKLSTFASFPAYRVRLVNGSSAQGSVNINSSFTPA